MSETPQASPPSRFKVIDPSRFKGYAPDEPMPRQVQPHDGLPYGEWICGDGRQVLYNRGYEPIWQRLGEGEASPADADEWVADIVDKSPTWWTDWEHPLNDMRTVYRCLGVLARFGVPLDAIEAAERAIRDHHASSGRA